MESPLKRESTGKGETKPGRVSPLKRENTDEGETKPGGESPLKRENTGGEETNAAWCGALDRNSGCPSGRSETGCQAGEL